MKINEWADNLSLIDEGHDKLAYLVELARKETSLPAELRTKDRLVDGCMSQIWIDVGVVEDKVKVYYDSDDFQSLNIAQLLTQQRRNGLGNLIETIRKKVHVLC